MSTQEPQQQAGFAVSRKRKSITLDDELMDIEQGESKPKDTSPSNKIRIKLKHTHSNTPPTTHTQAHSEPVASKQLEHNVSTISSPATMPAPAPSVTSPTLFSTTLTTPPITKRVRMIGEYGKRYIKEGLSTTNDPAMFIGEFQEQYGIHVKDGKSQELIKHAMTLCSAAGVKRHTIYSFCFNTLLRKIEANMRLSTSSAKANADRKYNTDQLLKIVRGLLPYVSSNAQLRNLAIQSIQALRTQRLDIPHDVIHQLVSIENGRMLQSLPIDIRTLIYESDIHAADRYFLPLINSYVQRQHEAEFRFPLHSDETATNQPTSVSVSVSVSATNAKSDRSHDELLNDMIRGMNKSQKLYGYIMKRIQAAYKSTAHQSYTTLRHQLLMKCHEEDLHEFFKHEAQDDSVEKDSVNDDLVHKFSWAFDAAMIKLDGRIMENLIDKIKSLKHLGNKDALACCMILNNRYIEQFLLTRIFNCLQACVDKQLLPSQHKQLPHYTEMLFYSVEIPNMMRHKNKFVQLTPQKLDVIIKEFYPTVVHLMLDDIHDVAQRINQPPIGNISLNFQQHILRQYTLYAAQRLKYARVKQQLPLTLSNFIMEANNSHDIGVYHQQSTYLVSILNPAVRDYINRQQQPLNSQSQLHVQRKAETSDGMVLIENVILSSIEAVQDLHAGLNNFVVSLGDTHALEYSLSTTLLLNIRKALLESYDTLLGSKMKDAIVHLFVKFVSTEFPQLRHPQQADVNRLYQKVNQSHFPNPSSNNNAAETDRAAELASSPLPADSGNENGSEGC